MLLNNSVKKLKHIDTLGVQSQRYRAEIFEFVLSRYHVNQALPSHEHADAYLCLNFGAEFQETIGRHALAEVPAFAVVSHPEGMAHRNSFGGNGGVCLSVFCTVRSVKSWQLATKSHEVRQSASVLDISAKLQKEVTRGELNDPCTALSMAELSQQLIQSIVAKPAFEQQARQGLIAALDAIRDEPARAWTLQELAFIAKLHPTHLARQVREITGQTFGEHLRRQRSIAAIVLLRNENNRIADVAHDCGFADQAHLTRTLRRLTGTTPRAIQLKR